MSPLNPVQLSAATLQPIAAKYPPVLIDFTGDEYNECFIGIAVRVDN